MIKDVPQDERLKVDGFRFAEERALLEDLLDSTYFTSRRGHVLHLMRQLESSRELAVACLENPRARDVASEAGRAAAALSLYVDALGHLADGLTIERDAAEQRIRSQVQGPMSVAFDDFYGLHAEIDKDVQVPIQDIDTMTDAADGALSRKYATLAGHQIKLTEALTQIEAGRVAVEQITCAQLGIVRTQVAALRLERCFHDLRLRLNGDVPITEG